MTLWLWLAVAAIGGCGAIARFVIDALIAGRVGRDFPLGTLAINLTGTLLLGVLVGARGQQATSICSPAPRPSAPTRRSPPGCLRPTALPRMRNYGPAVLNAVLSLLLGFGAALLGRTIGLHL